MSKPETSPLSHMPEPQQEEGGHASPRVQAVVGVVIAALALLMGISTLGAHAGDAGAQLVPRWCAVALWLCGVWLVLEARRGGWRYMPTLGGGMSWQITPWVWVSAGFLMPALLMRTTGFVVAAALCYVLALQGLRMAAQPGWRVGARRLVGDGVVGLVLSVVVYALFAQVLGMTLPAGWLAWK